MQLANGIDKERVSNVHDIIAKRVGHRATSTTSVGCHSIRLCHYVRDDGFSVFTKKVLMEVAKARTSSMVNCGECSDGLIVTWLVLSLQQSAHTGYSQAFDLRKVRF
jgi:hypothetical protein